MSEDKPRCPKCGRPSWEPGRCDPEDAVAERDAEIAALREALELGREALRESFLVISRQNPLSIPVVKMIDTASQRIDAALSAQRPTPPETTCK